MTSFRKADSQVKHIIRQANAVGKGRHDSRDDFKVHSVGTARNYKQSLNRLVKWLKENKLGELKTLDFDTAIKYLDERKHTVKQSTLDQDRQAIQVCLQDKLPVIKSEQATKLRGRTYTPQQIEMVAEAQSPANALATKIAAAAGLRAHELLSLRSWWSDSASHHRQWSKDRFDDNYDDVSVGRIKATLVDIESASDDRECIFDVFDHDSQKMSEYYGAIFCEDGELHQHLIREGCKAGFDWPDYLSKILFIDEIMVLPKFRNQKIGLAAMSRTIQKFGSGCDIVVIKAEPLQFMEDAPDDYSEYQFEEFTDNRASSLQKLKRHYKRLGFKATATSKTSNYMFLNLHYKKPRVNYS